MMRFPDLGLLLHTLRTGANHPAPVRLVILFVNGNIVMAPTFSRGEALIIQGGAVLERVL